MNAVEQFVSSVPISNAGPLLVVAHGHIIQLLSAKALGLPVSKRTAQEELPNAGIATLFAQVSPQQGRVTAWSKGPSDELQGT